MLCVYDLETSGLPAFNLPADDPSQPWIVELAAVLCEEDGTIVDEYESIVLPRGYVIPDDVAAIHGITTGKALAEGRPAEEVFERAHAMMRSARMTLSYGARFDEKLRRGHLRRLGLSDCFGEWPVGCIQPLATALCKIAPTAKMMASGRKWAKTPKLIEAHEILLGKPFDDAHRAMPDCKAAARVLFECIRRGHEPKPIVWPSEKPNFQKAAETAPEPATEVASETAAPPPPSADPVPPQAESDELEIF